jgi:hypothetical protein
MSQWVRASEIAVVDHGDRMVLLNLADLTRPLPQVLEGSGAMIWRALGDPGEPRPFDVIVGDVAGSYSVESDAVAEDVRTYLAGLQDRGLAFEVGTTPRT